MGSVLAGPHQPCARRARAMKGRQGHLRASNGDEL